MSSLWEWSVETAAEWTAWLLPESLRSRLFLTQSEKEPETKRDSEKPLEPKSTELSRTVITQIIRPQHTDDRGFAFGGEILAWIDIVAGVAAKRHAGKPAVTASIDSVHFLAPVKIGDMCILRATVNRSWRTSMEVGVLVEAENMLDGSRRFCCYALLTFVAVQDGVPVPVAPILPQTEEERLSFANAETRRQARFARKRTCQVLIPIHCKLVKPPPEAPRKGHPKPTPRDRASFSSQDSDADRMLFRSLSEKTPSESYTEFIEIVFPEHANSLGITFGGQILKWMEYTAIMAAAKHCRSHLLTASMDSVTFLRPTKVGDVVIIKGIVSQAFEHSIEVYVTVEREHLETCEKEITNNAYLTIVSVDQKGQLLSVPPLRAESEEEKARGEQGKERQKRRLEERKEIDKLVY